MLRRVEREPQPRGPPARALEELRSVGSAARGRDQCRYFPLVETQIRLTNLRHVVLRAQARERERRIHAAADHDAPLVRQPLEQEIDELEHGRIGDAMRIVDDDQAALHFGRGKSIQQLRSDDASLAARVDGGGDERIGRRAPWQVERLERGEQAAEEPMQIVVDVRSDPCDCDVARQASQLTRQRGGFAEAGWGTQEGETAGREGIAEPPLERFTSDEVGAHARRLDLRDRKCGGLHGGIGHAWMELR